MVTEESGARRKRRTPEAAQREIIEAAEQFLRERPFHELTVDEVMRRTGLSRPSFYVYFKDRHDLVLRVTQHLVEEMLPPAQRWLTGFGSGDLHSALEGSVAVYRDHAPVFRALADAAADDDEVEATYTGLVQGFIELTAQQIRDEMSAGRITGLDADETAKAIVWMAERYLYLSFGPGSDSRDIEPIVETLYKVIQRTFYGSG